MEKKGKIEVKVKGKTGGLPISPETFDIKEIIELMENVEDLLYPEKPKSRPIISYNIEEGSVKHIFITSPEPVIAVSAILSQVKSENSIDFLGLRRARAIENIQKFSVKRNYEFQFQTSRTMHPELLITPESNFYRSENLWVDAEFYFYGTLKDAGGKNKANIHLDTESHGYLTIETGQDFLKKQEENLLYKEYGVRVSGKQNIETGEIDSHSLRLIEIIDYRPAYDKDYIDRLIRKASKSWEGIDIDNWLASLRGGYDE